MNVTKYIGMDVHTAMTVIAVLSATGKVVAEAIIETKASAILDFIKSQRGTLWVTFEEGTQAAWLYDLIQPHVAKVVVCDPRKITTEGNKADRPDAKRLAELLRTNALTPVYHGEHSTKDLKELARSYSAIVRDGTRAKNRLKALFRARGIPCSGGGVYMPEDREHWLEPLEGPGVRARAGRLWKQIDLLDALCEEAETDMVAEASKHAATKILQSLPGIGPVRAALILAFAITPHRFRSKRQFWTYVGLAVVTRVTSEYELVQGRVRRSKKRKPAPRGLNKNCNRVLKDVFKGAAGSASRGPWKQYFESKVASGTDPHLVLLTMARKIAAITLAVWRKGERYDKQRLTMQVA
jgi:transposase